MTRTSLRKNRRRPARLVATGLAALLLAVGAPLATAATEDTAETTEDTEATEGTDAAEDTDAGDADTSPGLPDPQGVDGSVGSLLNRDLGTGDQAFCADLGAKLAKLADQWATANAEGALETAGELRYLFANTNAANYQCLTAAGAALTSSGSGSLTGSLTLPLPGS
ncbi:hypothetical protein ACT3SZ_13455 [Corynebacterium sp. AOP40-9SA-29]|uniref:hypothetical protein n=1 Tax=Corynebacterium sp. AOP40-9SA-29 TaxID=3457677 RepID=UPI004033AC15